MDEDSEKIMKIFSRESRRFEKADLNSDKKLSMEEYFAFTNPEIVEHMKDLVVKEALEDMDTTKDGYISFDEYMGELSKYCLIYII